MENDMNTANNLIHMGNEIIAIGERMRSVISADPANAIEIGNATNPNPVQNNGTGEVPATLQQQGVAPVQQQQAVVAQAPSQGVAPVQQQQAVVAQAPSQGATMSAPEFVAELAALYPTHGEAINPALAEFGYKTAFEIQDDNTRLAVIAKIRGV